MKIGILGSGTVARTVGGKLAELGHEVMFGTRDVARALARKDPDAFGNPPFKDWQA
jgi:predicted dinucleotide-binding enzyme